MTTKHSPAPWHYDHDDGSVWHDITNPAAVTFLADNMDDDLRQADGALIAAAPEMLAALSAAEAFIAGLEGDELQEGIGSLLATVRAAIDKAEGRA